RGALVRERQREAGAVARAAKTRLQVSGAVRAEAGRRERPPAVGIGLAREELDDSADRARSVQRGSRTAYHLDPVDRRQRQVLGKPATAQRALDAHAVDEDDR